MYLPVVLFPKSKEIHAYAIFRKVVKSCVPLLFEGCHDIGFPILKALRPRTKKVSGYLLVGSIFPDLGIFGVEYRHP